MGALYAAEVCLVLGLVAWHRQIGRSNPAEFWASVSGIVTIVAFIGNGWPCWLSLSDGVWRIAELGQGGGY